MFAWIKPFKTDEKCFSLHLERDINFCPDVFGHVEKGKFKFKMSSFRKKSLQNTYCPISQEVNPIRQTDLVT